MAKMTAAEAGRKGGRSRSATKLAACRKNGFQSCEIEIPKSTADWLCKREQETAVKTGHLVRRLLRMEIASVDDLESEQKQARTPVLISAPKANEETR